MATEFSDQQLLGYLDEALPAELMVAIEIKLREDAELSKRLVVMLGQREAGLHSLGEMWRRHRLSCPTRQQLGSYLLGALEDEWCRYIRCHIEKVGCRVCGANLADLQSEQAQHLSSLSSTINAKQQRRKKYFESSAGLLRRND